MSVCVCQQYEKQESPIKTTDSRLVESLNVRNSFVRGFGSGFVNNCAAKLNWQDSAVRSIDYGQNPLHRGQTTAEMAVAELQAPPGRGSNVTLRSNK